MLPQHSDEYPNSKYLFFVPKRYPFTVSMSKISTPRVRYGKDWVVMGSLTPKPSIEINNNDRYDMYALVNIDGSDGTFTISY